MGPVTIKIPLPFVIQKSLVKVNKPLLLFLKGTWTAAEGWKGPLDSLTPELPPMLAPGALKLGVITPAATQLQRYFYLPQEFHLSPPPGSPGLCDWEKVSRAGHRQGLKSSPALLPFILPEWTLGIRPPDIFVQDLCVFIWISRDSLLLWSLKRFDIFQGNWAYILCISGKVKMTLNNM